MDAEQFKTRTKSFALRAIRLVGSLPSSTPGNVLGRQLVRCATSVGANYRSPYRARSRKEFVAKMGIVEEECDESVYWLELLADSGLMKADRLSDLAREANEILAMTVASIKSARR
ncbi:MAG: four helix bundle protein [Phycisphaerales bacterium]|nr:MAG: four helix bundle protein [Phycisphaerales bacterium]